MDIQFEGDVASDATNSPPPRGQRQVTTRAAAYDGDGDVPTDDDSEHEGPQLAAELAKKGMMKLMTKTKAGVSDLAAKLDKLQDDLREQQAAGIERYNEMLSQQLTTQQQQQQQYQAVLIQ